MELKASIEVRQNLDEVWEFVANPANSPKWDRSIASVKVTTNGPFNVGSAVETISPNGMEQSWKVKDFVPNQTLRFVLLESTYFKYAELTFVLTSTPKGTLIDHQISLKFKFKHLFLYPLLRLSNKNALQRDLNSLKNTLNEIYN